MSAGLKIIASDARLKAACHRYDGDACRPESGLTVEKVAATMLREHWDIARCFCPACVLADAVLADTGNVSGADP